MNPFDDTSKRFLILVNPEQQHSLWPAGLDVPAGWQAVGAPLGHQEALDRIAAWWTDLRPASARGRG